MKTSITILVFLLQTWFISAYAVNEAPIPKDSLSKDNYPVLGITFGFPGVINLLCGYHFGEYSIRGEIGTWFLKTFGVKANLCYNLLNSKSFESNLSIGAGYNYTNIFGDKVLWGGLFESESSFIGAFIDLNVHGVFLEVGFHIIGNFNNNNPLSGIFNNNKPSFSLQLGYVYRFND